MLLYAVKELALAGKVLLDVPHRTLYPLLGGTEDVCRKDCNLIHKLQRSSSNRIKHLNLLNLVSKEDYPAPLVSIRKVNVYAVSLNPESSPLELHIIAGIEAVHQLVEELRTGHHLPHLNPHRIGMEVCRVANTVQAGNTAHHNHIPSSTQ